MVNATFLTTAMDELYNIKPDNSSKLKKKLHLYLTTIWMYYYVACKTVSQHSKSVYHGCNIK